jgi:AraC family transcriptional regulator
MDEVQALSLKFKKPDRRPDMQRTVKWSGIVCEHTRISNQSDYAFSLTGSTHYLALHDLVLADGSMLVDGLKPVAGGDLRNKLTYLPPQCSITGWASPVDRTNSFTVLYFDPAVIAEETERLYSSADHAPLIYFDDPSLRSTLIKLQEIVTDETADDGLYAETLGLLAAIEFHRLQSRGLPPAVRSRIGGVSAGQEKLVREFIEDRLAEEIRLDDLAGVVRLSRFHFARAFKSSLGEPPHRYVMKRRIEKAKDLLVRTSLPVNDIALATGFRSASQFNRAFKEFVGITPSTCRRNSLAA